MVDFFCVLLSLGEMFIKHAQIQLDWHLEFCHVLSQTAPRCANGTHFAFKHKVTDIWIKFFKRIFCCPFLFVCSFTTWVEKWFYVNKTRQLDFIVLITHDTLRKDVCVFFAILISKSVSWAIFDTQLLYFIRKLFILQYRSKVSWQSLETRMIWLETRKSLRRNLWVKHFEFRVANFEFRVSSCELQVSSRVSRQENSELTGRFIALFPDKTKPGKRLHYAAFHWT